MTMDAVQIDKTSKTYLTSGEVARLLGCSSYWVNCLINQGRLDTYRLNGKGWHRISVDALKQYAATRDTTLNWELLQ